ncbi:MAG: transcription/translation regulatory transformer protein RfaH [Gammaproteobacteria bacterium]|nr:transcription/translation regulatory transformer protein RfaH [Gammaproteobacteria bacterium]
MIGLIENPTKTARWYLLQTKFKQENKAAQELGRQNISVFLPLYKLEKMIKGNKFIKEEPLFSRYLFAWLDLENTNWTSIRSTRGISNFVAFGNGPAIVDQAIINELMQIDLLPKETYFKAGEKIRVASGPLEGLSAIYETENGSLRSYILMEFMQQEQYLSIDNQLIEKI